MSDKYGKGSKMKNLKSLFVRNNTVNSSFVLLRAAAAFCLVLSGQGFGRVIDLKGHWNDQIPLENPHKGWYHHFPDNGLHHYIIAKDTDLTEFPGMDHLYIRLAWSYLEPQEGQFNWDIIDQMIEKWTALNLGIAFRISCKETSANRIEQQFATPRWVMEAGAKGGYYAGGKEIGPDGPWEPDFNDPIFLKKLESFLKAFSGRYDGQPWLRYVDIGSIGDWGEGHCWAGSRKDYGYKQRKVHVDLYLKYFKKSPLVISDDFVYTVPDKQERIKLHQYIVDSGIGYRDDSPLVNGTLGSYADTYSVRSPEFFEAVYRNRLTVFELEHYGKVKSQGNWTAEPGSTMAARAPGKDGPEFFRRSLELLHATYIGYHGDAHEWLTDNPKLTVELLNKCGYWYFPHSAELPESIRGGQELSMAVVWENRGVAPAYNSYDIVLRLKGPDSVTVNMPSGNERWLPSKEKGTIRQEYRMRLPSLAAGEYDLGLKLYSPQAARTVYLGLDPQIMDKEHFYRIGTVKVTE